MAGNLPVARSMLQHIPDDTRPEAVRGCVASLRADSSVPEVSLTASLLAQCQDSEALDAFVLYLENLLTQGRRSDVVAALESNLEVGTRLLTTVISSLEGFAKRGPSAGLQDLSIEGGSRRGTRLSHDLSPLIDFARLANVSSISSEHMRRLYLALLSHLASPHTSTQLAARDALVTLFSNPERNTETDDTLIWQHIKRLLVDQSNLSSLNLGYSLWLWWASANPISLSQWFDEQYWSLLQAGLRFGDNERRKQCLGILRHSVAIAAADQALHQHICSQRAVPSSSPSIQAQYDRYFTVFETCILGRYLNQVIACEEDIDVLISDESIVQSRWICCLLSAALDPRVQESNRKFIGGLILRKRYQPQHPDEFHDFFQGSIMPWLVQGHLFTDSLTRLGGQQRCTHGDRLAEYIQDLLYGNASDLPLLTSLIDAVFESLTGRKAARFSYAAVYFIHGLATGLARVPDFRFSASQSDRLLELSSAIHLPEIARDYVYLRCLQLASRHGTRSSPDPDTMIDQWQELQAGDCEHLRPTLAALQAKPSTRDALEKQTRKKMKDLLASCLSNLATGDALNTLLFDIREDMAYLEYPKRLLLQWTNLLFQPALLRAALGHDGLGAAISTNIRDLQQMSANRAYLISPLALGMSSATLRHAEFRSLVSPRDFILQYCERLPKPSLDLRLEEATSVLLQTTISPKLTSFGYSYYFGEDPSTGVAALLDLVARTDSTSEQISQDVFSALLSKWVAQRTPPPTVSPWKSTLQLQVMILCCEDVVSHATTVEAQRILKDLHYILAIEPLPRYRYLLSWMIARIYLRHADLTSHVLTQLGTKDHHSNPKYLASLMKIATMLTKAPNATEEYGRQLASACIPLSASSKVVIRHEAQWQIPLLLDYARLKGWASVTENPGFLALDEYIRSLERFDDPPLERILDRFDPVAGHTLTNLTEGLWYGLDDIETSVCGRADFLRVEQELTRKLNEIPPRHIPLGPAIVQPVPTDISETTAPNPASEDLALAPGKGSESRALQTKGSAYLATYNDPHARRRDVVVVASLVDNPYNLGGISRVCEVFGAAEMHLQNQNVTSNRDFQNVAVSSHLHFPILQLSASGVPGFLTEKRAQGYSIVGIEQTDRSVLLGSRGCALPEKIVLVIGSEKEGIPALVLSECDVLVEIPQQGVTRSLNVQTAVSIVLFEYARQHGETK